MHTKLPMAAFVIILALATALSAPARAAQLIMVERANCHWCEVFDREIGRTYHQTRFGKHVPLRRVNLHGTRPADLRHLTIGKETPTFILLHEGRVVLHMRGYVGKERFWQLLNSHLKISQRKIDHPPVGQLKMASSGQ